LLGEWGWNAGKAYKHTYEKAEDFKTHIEYMQYLYSGSWGGFFTRAAKSASGEWSQQLNCKKIHIYKNRYHEQKDVYISMNSFKSKKRGVDNVKRLNALYIDIDCYKVSKTKEQVLYELEQDYFGHSIPVPTFIIDSGRGLYLIWQINEGAEALPRWNRVQKYLYEQLKALGADSSALDAARVLRVPGSVNSNNGEKVKIIEFNNVKYTLHEIIHEYSIDSGYAYRDEDTNVWGKATKCMRECAGAIAQEQGLEQPDYESFEETWGYIGTNGKGSGEGNWGEPTRNQITFARAICGEKGLEMPEFRDYGEAWTFIGDNLKDMARQIKNKKPFIDGYLMDIYKVLTSRKGEDCRREKGLFLTRLLWGEKTGDYNEALNMTLLLNAQLDKPHDKNYVITHTQSAETILKQGKTYKYSIKRIMEDLSITEEEMQKLSLEHLYTRTPEREKERRREYDHERYIKSQNGKKGKSKSQEISERRETMAKLLAENKNGDEIREKLNIGVRTYYHDKACVMKEGLLERAITAAKEASEKIVAAAKERAEQIKTEIARSAKKLGKSMKSGLQKIPLSIVYKNNDVILIARCDGSWQEEFGKNRDLLE